MIQKPFSKLSKYIELRLARQQLDENIQFSMTIARMICQQINEVESPIVSSNIPMQSSDHSMVLIVQNYTDQIMEQPLSLLERIIKIGQMVEDFSAGNCQQKTFLGVFLTLKQFISMDIATSERTPSIEIKYCDDFEGGDTAGHFFFIINNHVICDPWANLYFPRSLFNDVLSKTNETERPIYKGYIRDYFKIDQNWGCWQAERENMKSLINDKASTEYTYALFNLLKKTFEMTTPTTNTHDLETAQNQSNDSLYMKKI